jgi:hypothetical protein
MRLPPSARWRENAHVVAVGQCMSHGLDSRKDIPQHRVLFGLAVEAASEPPQVTRRHKTRKRFVNGCAGIEVEKLPRVEHALGSGLLKSIPDAIGRAVVGVWSSHYVR